MFGSLFASCSLILLINIVLFAGMHKPIKIIYKVTNKENKIYYSFSCDSSNVGICWNVVFIRVARPTRTNEIRRPRPPCTLYFPLNRPTRLLISNPIIFLVRPG